MSEAILTTAGLGKRFGNRWAVKDLNLEVRAGDVFGFLGPNGAGKSTTIRIILTLLSPTSGSVKIFGKDVSGNRESVLSRVCGIVEKPDFYLYLSAYKNLELLGSLTRKVKRNEIFDALEIVGLKSRAFDKVKAFSHGMKQRLGIAQAILTKPELVILDEPTSGLDPQGMKEVRELVLALSREHGTTIFLSSHLLTEVEAVANRMAVLNHGELIAQGKVSELLNGDSAYYSIQASPQNEAVELLRKMPWVEIVSVANGIDVHIDSRRAAELNRLLVTNAIEVSSFAAKRTLEDYFLKITEGASEG
ncbi:MAG: ABC transporter ATP-binding protein [Bacteroidetes bacterium]|nr:ABC transporter ATP-binding protein [Bacteroidota bacterium]MCL5738779.1 ABC transporter ATP-binding protein [Bacteroidota bacterium]